MTDTMTDAEKAAGSRLDYDLMMAEEYILSEVEKNFILACERGDLPGVKKSVLFGIVILDVSLQLSVIFMLVESLRSTLKHHLKSSTLTAQIP